MLTGLTSSVECTGYLSTTERTVIQQTAIFTGKRYSLSYTLIDNIVRNLCQTIYIRFTGTIVSTLDRIIEKTIHAITVILIVFRSINTALRSN